MLKIWGHFSQLNGPFGALRVDSFLALPVNNVDIDQNQLRIKTCQKLHFSFVFFQSITDVILKISLLQNNIIFINCRFLFAVRNEYICTCFQFFFHLLKVVPKLFLNLKQKFRTKNYFFTLICTHKRLNWLKRPLWDCIPWITELNNYYYYICLKYEYRY